MASDAESPQYAVYTNGSDIVMLRSVLDGEVVSTVPLRHMLLGGTSRDDMIATIGFEPYSVIIIKDRHEHEQHQRIDLPVRPRAVAISPAQDRVAVLLSNGLLDV